MHERLLKVSEVQARLGISRPTIYNWMETGRLPRPIKFSAKCVRWPESVIDAWIEATAARSAEAAQ